MNRQFVFNSTPLGEINIQGMKGYYFPWSFHIFLLSPFGLGIKRLLRALHDDGNGFERYSRRELDDFVSSYSIICHESAHWLQSHSSSLDAMMLWDRFDILSSIASELAKRKVDNRLCLTIDKNRYAVTIGRGDNPFAVAMGRNGVLLDEISAYDMNSMLKAKIWLYKIFSDCTQFSGNRTSAIASHVLSMSNKLLDNEDIYIRRISNFIHLYVLSVLQGKYVDDSQFFLREGLSAINLKESFAIVQQIYGAATAAAIINNNSNVNEKIAVGIVDRLYKSLDSAYGTAFRAFLGTFGDNNAWKSIPVVSWLRSLCVLIDCALNPTKTEIEACIASPKSEFYERWLAFHPFSRFIKLLDSLRVIGVMDSGSISPIDYLSYRNGLLSEANLGREEEYNAQARKNIYFEDIHPSLHMYYKFFSKLDESRKDAYAINYGEFVLPFAPSSVSAEHKNALSILRDPPFFIVAGSRNKSLGNSPIVNPAISPGESYELLKTIFASYIIERLTTERDKIELHGFHLGRECIVIYQAVLDSINDV